MNRLIVAALFEPRIVSNDLECWCWRYAAASAFILAQFALLKTSSRCKDLSCFDIWTLCPQNAVLEQRKTQVLVFWLHRRRHSTAAAISAPLWANIDITLTSQWKLRVRTSSPTSHMYCKWNNCLSHLKPLHWPWHTCSLVTMPG